MKLSDFILKTAENAFETQNKNGSFPQGHNGPYYHPETPVRNSSHWLMIFAKCHELSGRHKFKNKVHEVAEYLYSKDARPNGFSFYHRHKMGKDMCNGLIGQAWTFEALAEATRTLKDDKYALLAEDVFFQHPFNEKRGLWNCLEIDGKVLTIDGTFNHQLWFAAAASLIKGNHSIEVMNRVNRFMDSSLQNLIILENGLIYHLMKLSLRKRIICHFSMNDKIARHFDNLIKTLRYRINPLTILRKEQAIKNKNEENIYYKSVGYHSFNMYAFSILNTQIPAHSFWESESFRMAVNYMLTDAYKNNLNNSKYSYPYNPPGFEVPYSLSILKDMNEKELTKISQWWISEQFKKSYNKKTGLMDKNSEDPLTSTARIYELTRLPPELLKKIRI